MANKSQDMVQAVRQHAPGVFEAMRQPGEGAYLSREEIMVIGEMLGADLVVRGSLSEYGVQRKPEADWRTFIPPFLGLFNPEREGMIEATMYMYDAHSGELVWVVYENIEMEPPLPLFKTNFEVMDSAEAYVARKMVSHLVFPPIPEEEFE
jgi:hypothetical protein